jgi:hypothetical protein
MTVKKYRRCQGCHKKIQGSAWKVNGYLLCGNCLDNPEIDLSKAVQHWGDENLTTEQVLRSKRTDIEEFNKAVEHAKHMLKEIRDLLKPSTFSFDYACPEGCSVGTVGDAEKIWRFCPVCGKSLIVWNVEVG